MRHFTECFFTKSKESTGGVPQVQNEDTGTVISYSATLQLPLSGLDFEHSSALGKVTTMYLY